MTSLHPEQERILLCQLMGERVWLASSKSLARDNRANCSKVEVREGGHLNT